MVLRSILIRAKCWGLGHYKLCRMCWGKFGFLFSFRAVLISSRVASKNLDCGDKWRMDKNGKIHTALLLSTQDRDLPRPQDQSHYNLLPPASRLTPPPISHCLQQSSGKNSGPGPDDIWSLWRTCCKYHLRQPRRRWFDRSARCSAGWGPRWDQEREIGQKGCVGDTRLGLRRRRRRHRWKKKGVPWGLWMSPSFWKKK